LKVGSEWVLGLCRRWEQIDTFLCFAGTLSY
jgi:hypothetical protein